MYVQPNYKTKKQLALAVEDWNLYQSYMRISGQSTPEATAMWRETHPDKPVPKPVYVYQPNDLFNTPVPPDGRCCVEGPHYPEPHRWYATVELKDGLVVSVK